MLIDLLIAVIVFGILYWVITMIPLPPPFRTIAMVVMALIAIIWLLGFVGGGPWLLHR